jgi:hypothetical protein
MSAHGFPDTLSTRHASSTDQCIIGWWVCELRFRGSSGRQARVLQGRAGAAFLDSEKGLGPDRRSAAHRGIDGERRHEAPRDFFPASFLPTTFRLLPP